MRRGLPPGRGGQRAQQHPWSRGSRASTWSSRADDPTRFVLVEAYRTPEATALHKETAHYKTWRDTVADMMAEPRTSVKYANLFPEDAGW